MPSCHIWGKHDLFLNSLRKDCGNIPYSFPSGEKAKCMRMFLAEERDYWLNIRLGWQGDTVYRTRSNPINITFNGRDDEVAEINGGIENNSRESDWYRSSQRTSSGNSQGTHGMADGRGEQTHGVGKCHLPYLWLDCWERRFFYVDQAMKSRSAQHRRWN